jgi:hypothetical protein
VLTEEGMRERKWGEFPALRRALEDKTLPPGHCGHWVSTADTSRHVEHLVAGDSGLICNECVAACAVTADRGVSIRPSSFRCTTNRFAAA